LISGSAYELCVSDMCTGRPIRTLEYNEYYPRNVFRVSIDAVVLVGTDVYICYSDWNIKIWTEDGRETTHGLQLRGIVFMDAFKSTIIASDSKNVFISSNTNAEVVRIGSIEQQYVNKDVVTVYGSKKVTKIKYWDMRRSLFALVVSNGMRSWDGDDAMVTCILSHLK